MPEIVKYRLVLDLLDAGWEILPGVEQDAAQHALLRSKVVWWRAPDRDNGLIVPLAGGVLQVLLGKES